MKKIEKNEGKKDKCTEMVEWYRWKSVEMIRHINNKKFIKMIYGYVNSAYKEDKSRG